jgi:pimeloyl-[acyl-carrier protein] methyl ester esterase
MLHKKVVGEGDNIVLLHGWALNSKIWQPFVDRYADRFKFHLIDLPSSGKSSHVDMPEDIDDVMLLLQNVIPKNSTLIGWSLGGLFSIYFAYKYPNFLKKLSLICSNLVFVRKKNYPFAMPSTDFMMFNKQVINNSHSAIKTFINLQLLNTTYDKKAKMALIRQTNENIPTKKNLLRGLHLLQNTDLTTVIQKINIPIKALFGKNDKLVPAQAVDGFKKYNPRVKTKIIPSAAHIPFLTHPTQCLWLCR